MDKHFQIRVEYGWSVKKYRNAEKDIDKTLQTIANEAIGDLIKNGQTSGDLDYIDDNGNKYVGIISIYHKQN